MRKIKIKNKKAQLGATLTWLPAAFIIIFIILLFIAAAFFIARNKGEIIVKREEDVKIDLASMKLLSFTMNMPTVFDGESRAMKELVVNWSLLDGAKRGEVRDKIKTETENILKKSTAEKECYIFQAKHGLEYLEKLKEIAKTDARVGALPPIARADIARRTIEFDNLLNIADPRVSRYTEARKENMLDKAAEIEIISGGEEIKVKLYTGKCY